MGGMSNYGIVLVMDFTALSTDICIYVARCVTDEYQTRTKPVWHCEEPLVIHEL